MKLTREEILSNITKKVTRDNGKNFTVTKRLDYIKMLLADTPYEIVKETPLAVIYRKKGKELPKEVVLISSHVDVVPEMTKPDFDGKDKVVYKGTFDNAATNAAVVIAMSENRLADNVVIAFTGDEEENQNGAKQAIQYLADEEKKVVAIALDVTFDLDSDASEKISTFKSASYTIDNLGSNTEERIAKKLFEIAGKLHIAFMVTRAQDEADYFDDKEDKIKDYYDPIWEVEGVADPDEAGETYYNSPNCIGALSLCLPTNDTTGAMHSNQQIHIKKTAFEEYIEAVVRISNEIIGSEESSKENKSGGKKGDKRKVAFFFGAGAEGVGNYELPDGLKFMREVFWDKHFFDEVTDALAEHFDGVYYDGKVQYGKDRINAVEEFRKAYLFAKASHDRDFFYKYYEIIKRTLKTDALEASKRLLGISNQDVEKNAVKKFDPEELMLFRNEFRMVLMYNIKYSELKMNINKELFENSGDTIQLDTNLGIISILDRYFSAIANPDKFGRDNYLKIFNYLWLCYFCVVKHLLLYAKKKEIASVEKYFVYDEAGNPTLNYRFILEHIRRFTKDIAGIEWNSPNTYYEQVKVKLQEKKDTVECVGVATTNYLNMCEIIGAPVAYLNGATKYMEFPEILEVIDLTKSKLHRNRMFFPFMFGQSMVKPIVDSKQIRQFFKLGKMLKESDVLCILGFALNEDDNHVNEFVHEHIKRGRRILYVTDNVNDKISKKLKCSPAQEGLIEYCIVEYKDNQKVVEKIFERIGEMKL